MSRSSVQRIVRGDIIIERVNGKNRMTPVKQVEFNACSSNGVHVNRSMCYDYNAVVDLVDGEGTLGDLEKEFATLNDLQDNDIEIEKPSNLSDKELEALASGIVKGLFGVPV